MIYQKLTMANGSRLRYPLTKDWRKPLANSGVLKPNLLHLEAFDYHIETGLGIVKYCHRCTTDYDLYIAVFLHDYSPPLGCIDSKGRSREKTLVLGYSIL